MADETPQLLPNGAAEPGFDWAATRDRLISYGLDPAALDQAAAADGIAKPTAPPKDERTSAEAEHDREWGVGQHTSADYKFDAGEYDAAARQFALDASMPPSLAKGVVERLVELDRQLDGKEDDEHERWQARAQDETKRLFGDKVPEMTAAAEQLLETVGGDFAKMIRTSGALHDAQVLSLLHAYAEHLSRWAEGAGR